VAVAAQDDDSDARARFRRGALLQDLCAFRTGNPLGIQCAEAPVLCEGYGALLRISSGCLSGLLALVDMRGDRLVGGHAENCRVGRWFRGGVRHIAVCRRKKTLDHA